jgi:hypothetical protein
LFSEVLSESKINFEKLEEELEDGFKNTILKGKL